MRMLSPGQTLTTNLRYDFEFWRIAIFYIIAEALKQDFKIVDSHELIKTNNFGKAAVNFEITIELINDFFASKMRSRWSAWSQFVQLHWINTTLGRGGSDILLQCPLALHTNVKFGLLTGCSLQIKEVKQAQPIAFISYQSHGVIILVPKFYTHNDPTRFLKKYSNPD
jgi:aspartokinase/homoserine dehydrogenase 1